MEFLRNLIYVPFGHLLRFLNNICGGHYVLTLFLFALLVKIVLLPLSIKQQKNQIKGAMLRPQMALIEKKYQGKTDQNSIMQKRQELMDLQQREGYSPFAGCLPMLIQFPVIIALYNIIRSPLTYICRWSDEVVAKLYNLSSTVIADPTKALKITDEISLKNIDQINLISEIRANRAHFDIISDELVSQMPSFSLFEIDFGLKPSVVFSNFSLANLALLLIPILTFLTSYLTMKLTKKYNGNLQQELAGQTQDQQMSASMMEWMMPIMSGVFGFILNGALGVYWVYQSVISIGQMALFNKIWPMPTFTPEQIREYEKSLKKKPKPNAPDPNRPKPRSLHHIDDDD